MAERKSLILSCEHGGNRIPSRYQKLFQGKGDLLNSHRGFDPGALSLAKHLADRLNAPLFSATTSRLLVDLNRSPGNRTIFSDSVRMLEKSEMKQLLESYYWPYHNRIAQHITDLINDGSQVIHLAVHSFTPVLAGRSRQADIGLLYDPARTAEKKFCQSWKDLLKQQLSSLRVRYNYPYRGSSDGLTRTLRSSFEPQDYVGIELEINQMLLGISKTFPADLQAILLETLNELLPND